MCTDNNQFSAFGNLFVLGIIEQTNTWKMFPFPGIFNRPYDGQNLDGTVRIFRPEKIISHKLYQRSDEGKLKLFSFTNDIALVSYGWYYDDVTAGIYSYKNWINSLSSFCFAVLGKYFHLYIGSMHAFKHPYPSTYRFRSWALTLSFVIDAIICVAKFAAEIATYWYRDRVSSVVQRLCEIDRATCNMCGRTLHFIDFIYAYTNYSIYYSQFVTGWHRIFNLVHVKEASIISIYALSNLGLTDMPDFMIDCSFVTYIIFFNC